MAEAKKDQRIPVMMSEPDVERIDSWRAQQKPILNRSEAIRRLVEAGLDRAAAGQGI